MKTQQLSEHFSLHELVSSATADKYHINNMPYGATMRNLRILCQEVLEPLRREFGPIFINSGYRCPLLNQLLHGVGNSQHLYGQAADIRLKSEQQGQAYFDFILTHCDFDQMLFEHSKFGVIWLHVSCKPNKAQNRHMALRHLRA